MRLHMTDFSSWEIYRGLPAWRNADERARARERADVETIDAPEDVLSSPTSVETAAKNITRFAVESPTHNTGAIFDTETRRYKN